MSKSSPYLRVVQHYLGFLSILIWFKRCLTWNLWKIIFLLNWQIWSLFQPIYHAKWQNCKFITCLQAITENNVLLLIIVLYNMVTIYFLISKVFQWFILNYTDFAHATLYIKPSTYDSISQNQPIKICPINQDTGAIIKKDSLWQGFSIIFGHRPVRSWYICDAI